MMDWLKKLVSAVLLVVYAFLFASTNLFYHSHHCEDKIVVHSHLFGGQQHSHSAQQIQVINMVASAPVDVASPVQVPLFYEGRPQCVSSAEVILNAPKVSVLGLSLRAPPAFSC